MKMLKKISALLFAVCFFMLCPSLWLHAAEGTLQFSDPTGKVGDEITVKVKVITGGAAIGDGNVTVTYDPAMLEFVSGTNASGGNGTVNLAAAGDGTVSELEYTMVFKALAEGKTAIEASDYTAYLYSDETLNLTLGSGEVTVEPGDGTQSSTGGSSAVSGEADIEINGKKYSVYNDFSDALIPDGFVRTTLNYNNSERTVLQSETTGQYIFYLVTGNEDPVMALYDQDNQSFALTEMVSISDESYIMLLSTGNGNNLPAKFKETEISLGSLSFPAWQNSEDGTFYLLYAMNENGNESFYQYDTQEGTYQRYPVAAEGDGVKDTTTVTGKVVDFLQDHIIVIMAAVWAIILIFIIVVIVLGIKLRHANEELDEVYAENEAKADPKGSRAVTMKKSRDQFIGYRKSDDDDDLYDNDYEDEYEDDEIDYEDEYEEEQPLPWICHGNHECADKRSYHRAVYGDERHRARERAYDGSVGEAEYKHADKAEHADYDGLRHLG